VSYMARDENDHVKRSKLDALQLSKDEWDRVKLFLDLLVVSTALSHSVDHYSPAVPACGESPTGLLL